MDVYTAIHGDDPTLTLHTMIRTTACLSIIRATRIAARACCC
jgi:hypothetical protein